MKKIQILIFLNILIFGSIFGQNVVSLNLNHLLGGQEFGLNINAENDLNQEFYLTRLQYYISGISFFDENDVEYILDDTYILMTAGESSISEIILGEFDVDLVTKLKFYIGVDEDTNHLDPAQYPAFHPLAPQNPSMHWGWTGGYRFIALEGKSSPTLDQALNLHAIGDDNYSFTEIEVSSEAVDGKISIEINAEYSNALAGIDISEGVIQHGEILEIPFLIENFLTKVFTAGGNSVGFYNITEAVDFDIFPIPAAKNDKINIFIDVFEQVNIVEIYDTKGCIVQSLIPSSSEISVLLESSGSYVCILRNAMGQVVGNKQFIIR